MERVISAAAAERDRVRIFIPRPASAAPPSVYFITRTRVILLRIPDTHSTMPRDGARQIFVRATLSRRASSLEIQYRAKSSATPRPRPCSRRDSWLDLALPFQSAS
jgi:hypothetical protein